jgi:uncharacterized protein (TIGR03083 family)
MNGTLHADRTQLAREDITEGLAVAFERFATLLESRTPAEWDTPTRCGTWAVRDVAGHVVAQAEDVVALTIGQRTPDEQAASARDAAPAELARRLREASTTIAGLVAGFDDDGWDSPGPGDLKISDGVLALIADAYVHSDDIHEAIGRPVERNGILALALTRTIQRLQESEVAPAMRLELDGVAPVQVGAGGPTITTDPHHFILVATGRADPTVLGLDETVNLYR